MTGEIKKLASETVLYGLGTILPRMLNFLLVPLYTRVFAQEDYGAISEFYGYVAFANIVYLFGMETAFFRYSNKSEEDSKRVFRITQTVVLTISLTCSISFLFSYKSLATAFSVFPNRVIIWILLTILVDAVVAIPFARLRLKKEAVKFASFKIINIILFIGLNYYFLKYYDSTPSIEFVFLANFMANAIYLLFFFKDLISWRPLFDKKLSPEILTYSYPIVLTGLAGMTNEMFSRIAIDNWLPPNFYAGKSSDYIQGVFSACYRYSVFMSLVVQAFRFAAEPFFFSKAEDKKSPSLFAKVNHYFILVACTIMIGICLNMDWLQYILDDGYREGLNIVPILLLAYIFLGIYYNMSIWFKVTDRTYFGTIITIVGAVATVLFNYWLIPVYGIIGSSIVTLLCYFIMTVLCYFIGQKYYPIPYTIGKDLGVILVTCLLVYINSQIVIENPIIAVGLRGIASLIILWLVYQNTFKKTIPS